MGLLLEDYTLLDKGQTFDSFLQGEVPLSWCTFHVVHRRSMGYIINLIYLGTDLVISK